MRKKNNIFRIIILLFLLHSNILSAETGQAGTESNLSLGFGARAFSMGQAFTAIADDPTAVFWNPAGLEFVYQQSVSLFHMGLYEGTNYDFLGFVYPTLNIGTFGFGIARIGIGGVPERDITNYQLGTFSWDEFHGFFSYAKHLPWNLTSGITVRVVRRAFNGLQADGDLTAIGVGMDLGLLYKPQFFTSMILRDWSFGFNIRNLFKPQVKEGDGIDGLPLSVRFGIARKILISGNNQLHFALDVDYSQNRDMYFHFGTEYNYNEFGLLRAGFDGHNPTFGAGVKYNIFQIDYAFGSPTDTGILPSVHRFSLSFNFGMNRDQLFEISELKRKENEERLVARMRETDRQKFIEERLTMADSYFEQGNFLDAFVEYQQVIGQDPFNSRANIMLDSSDVLLKEKMNSEQALAVQSALDKERAESNRQYFTEHFDKGRLFLDKKQFTEALIEFNIARERVPGNPTVINAISTTKRQIREELDNLILQSRREFQNGNFAAAMQMLSDARVLGGEDPAIQNEIEALNKRIQLQADIQNGLNLFEIGQYDQALNIFEDALRENPDNELVKQYYEKSKIETNGKTEDLDPAAERRFLEGVNMFVKGRYQEAISIWEEVQKLQPYNKKVLKALEGARERLKKSK